MDAEKTATVATAMFRRNCVRKKADLPGRLLAAATCGELTSAEPARWDTALPRFFLNVGNRLGLLRDVVLHPIEFG